MACSSGCGTSCSTNCSTTSSGNCGGCGTACSTSCQTTASGQSCSGCGTLCSSSCGDSCHGTCSGSCVGTCSDTCTAGCNTTCYYTCTGTCNSTCSASCANDCSGTCSGGCQGCTASCQNDCSGCSGCGGSCSYNCSGDCEGGCYGSCNTTCTADCQNDCNSGCNDRCKDSCKNTCKDTCTGTCVGGCGASCDNTCNTGCENSCSSNCTSLCSIAGTYGESETNILNFDYTGAVQSVTLKPGKYVLECWGAQGGGRQNDSNIDSANGGAGGYSIGTLILLQSTTLYIYVGGMGKSVGSGLAEGGFNGGGCAYGSGTNEPGNGGGGATDIRLNQDSLYSRVIVAGGGGGAGEDSGDVPGYGGGTSGGTSSGHGAAATQTSTGTGGVFGYGAHTRYDGGAGGGGWYGGGTNGGSQTKPTSNDSSDTSGGCGGSGYVYVASSASNYPSGCLLNSSYYLTDAQTIAGNQTFKSPTNTNETGHSGNGYCRITCYVPKKTYFCKVGNTIKQSPVVIAKANNKLFDTGAAVMNLSYTGTSQNVVLPAGTYKFECWGAQGGYRSSSTYGGKGGYSVGTITLTQTTNLFVYVGGSGNSATAYTNGIYAGGFNGGGYRYGYKGGGGATDIRINKDDLYARIIVAGGGGSDGATTKMGMYGGGLEGGTTTESYGSGGYGGTQTGNTWLTTTRTTYASSTSHCYAGFGFGGNGCYYSSGYAGAGGGGWYGGSGSYPDGSGDDDRGGGGGSGYVYTAGTAANYPSGNYVNSSYYLTDASTVAGNQSFTAPDGSTETGHSGDGFCRITRIKNATVYVKQNNVWIKS